MSQQQKPNNTKDLLRFAGLAGQLFASLGIAVFAGYKLDGWLNLRFPLLVWLLPLLTLGGIIYGVIRSTKKKNSHGPN